MEKPTLKEARLAATLSLAELAARAKVSKTTIWLTEVGQRCPHPRTRRKIAAALGLPGSGIAWPVRETRTRARRHAH